MDFLTEDKTLLNGQVYALISVVSEDANQKSSQCALKIKGVFPDKESANDFVKVCMQEDPSFDIYLVEMGKWLPIPPKNEEIKDEVHQNQVLNDIIQGYKEQQVIAKNHFEERKREDLDATIQDKLKNKQVSEDNTPLQLSEEQLKDLRFSLGKPLTEDEFKQYQKDNPDNNIVKTNVD